MSIQAWENLQKCRLPWVGNIFTCPVILELCGLASVPLNIVTIIHKCSLWGKISTPKIPHHALDTERN
jgi:hypothetical protein